MRISETMRKAVDTDAFFIVLGMIIGIGGALYITVMMATVHPTTITIPEITKLSLDVSKLCLYRRFHLNNININITPKLKKAYSDADCTLNMNNQSCACTIHGLTKHNKVHATTICSNNESTVKCLTKIRLFSLKR